MPKIVPHPIKSDSIAVYGRMIGIRKMRYVLPTLVPIEIQPSGIEFTEQILIADSTLFSETIIRAEGILKGDSDMFSETIIRAEGILKGDSDMFSESPAKAETVIISNP